jgi:hypothetical protein
LNQVYTNLKGNQPHGTHTAWAMLTLIDAGQVCFFVVHQLACGFQYDVHIRLIQGVVVG